jgi:hypothetical protein
MYKMTAKWSDGIQNLFFKLKSWQKLQRELSKNQLGKLLAGVLQQPSMNGSGNTTVKTLWTPGKWKQRQNNTDQSSRERDWTAQNYSWKDQGCHGTGFLPWGSGRDLGYKSVAELKKKLSEALIKAKERNPKGASLTTISS